MFSSDRKVSQRNGHRNSVNNSNILQFIQMLMLSEYIVCTLFTHRSLATRSTWHYKTMSHSITKAHRIAFKVVVFFVCVFPTRNLLTRVWKRNLASTKVVACRHVLYTSQEQATNVSRTKNTFLEANKQMHLRNTTATGSRRRGVDAATLASTAGTA